ncbi:MAG TPA: hypothetical protein DDW55_01715 [Gammaproteobacteria bacterium]|nr:hypothetical protein [Gammaproteobacteria bacterium]
MIKTDKRITLFLFATVFIIFFTYYFFTSNYLPHGAGPDWKSNTDIAEFIYKNGRLPVLPDDEDSLHFTVYGGTRAFRPPLSYIVSAVVARSLDFTGMDTHVLLRKGSAFLCALAVALTFYALTVYTGSFWLGLLGAVLIGLMPQFTFIASYNNDDSGAIFTATLLITVLVRIYRYGVSTANAALLGLAGGLVILSKMTAWLLAPLVLLFLLLFVRTSWKSLLRYTLIAGGVFIIAGGWWFLFNMYHYGLDDPLQLKIANTVLEEHRRLPPDMGVGYAAKGIGFYELVFENYRNFLGESAKATIGNLDWLRLRVGPLQYAVYMAIFYIAIFYYLFSLAAFSIKKLRGRTTDISERRQLMFETLLVLTIFFQIYMYIWTNINNDIQIQGKYIIPVMLAVLLLFFSALDSLTKRVREKIEISQRTGFLISFSSAGKSIWLAALAFVALVHIDALANYVIPFYRPHLYNITIEGFRPFPLELLLQQKAINLDVRAVDDAIEYRVTGPDPKIVMGRDICRFITGNVLLRIDFIADQQGVLQVFLDEGNGFSAERYYESKYSPGENEVLFPVATRDCSKLRMDPAVENGTVTVKSLEISSLKIRPAP